GGGSRNARVSCMATLLVGRWRCLRNQTAAEESVHEAPCAKQICSRRKARLTVWPDFELVIGARLPVRPTGGNERTAALGKHHEQQQSVAALRGAHNRQ